MADALENQLKLTRSSSFPRLSPQLPEHLDASTLTHDIPHLSDTSSAKGGVHDETHFTFLSLPPEIRNAIYSLALVADPVDIAPALDTPEVHWEHTANDYIRPSAILPERVRYYCVNTRRSFIMSHDAAAKTTLVQPALTRTNKLIRAESLPIYYSGNHFKLTIPPDGRGDREDKWYRFVKMMRVFSDGSAGGKQGSWLRFIRRISAEYVEVSKEWDIASDEWLDDTYRTNERRFEIGFKTVPVTGRRNDATRIGDNDLDWKDECAIKEAFRKALEAKWKSHRSWGLEERVPVERIADALCMIARECPKATEWMKVTCLCPEDEICRNE